jgi:putative addiction module component (TIGR02574 family)
MPPTIQDLGLDRLSIDNRLDVAGAIWDSVARDAQAAPLPAGQRAELERRLADSIAWRNAVTPLGGRQSPRPGEGAAVSPSAVLRDKA